MGGAGDSHDPASFGAHRARRKSRGRASPDNSDQRVREKLLNAAEQITLKAGYAAVSSRAVAREAQVTAPLVHYYFRSMDELFLSLVQRFTKQRIERHAQALRSATQFKDAWASCQHPSDRLLTMQYSALASRSDAVRNELVRASTIIRRLQTSLCSDLFEDDRLKHHFGSPEVMAVIL